VYSLSTSAAHAFMATSSPPWIAPKKITANTNIHIEFAYAININVSGIRRRVALLVIKAAPYRSAALPNIEKAMTAESPAKKINKPKDPGDKS
jgi:hypothetical protein